MALSRRGGFRRVAKGPRRSREWIEWWTAIATTPTDPDWIDLGVGSIFANYILDPLQMQNEFDEPTMVRNIVRWWVTADGTPPMRLSAYFGLISSTLKTPPFFDAPVPTLDGADDWIWKTVVAGRADLAAGSAQLTQLPNDKYGFEDIKTKRKFSDGRGLMLVVENPPSSNVGFHFMMNGRTLFLNG